MHRRVLLEATALSSLAGKSAAAAKAASSPAPANSLDATLLPYLARHNLPALAAAVVQNGTAIAAGAVGTRRAGTTTPVTLGDRFHIGSDTKAMTALLAAMLIEQGKLRWDSRVAEVFPELAGTMQAGLGRVTLTQLLSHTSGIAPDNEALVRLVVQSYAQDNLNLDELRLWLVKQWSTEPLQSPPGTRFAYSNMGYIVAGAMLERSGHATWEELVATRVFDPLRLRTAGFGPQASLGRIDAPLGHVVQGDGMLKPMLAGPNGDAPAIFGPAGTVHLSILDFAAWAGWHAGEGRRGPALVAPQTWRRLHAEIIDTGPRPGAPPGTPSEGGYGLGWGFVVQPYSKAPFMAHAGSNTMNLASVMLQPKYDFGLVMATNVGGSGADAALKALAAELYGRFGPAPA